MYHELWTVYCINHWTEHNFHRSLLRINSIWVIFSVFKETGDTPSSEVHYSLPRLHHLNPNHHTGWVTQFRVKWRVLSSLISDHPTYFLVIAWPSSLKRPIVASKAHLNFLWDRRRENRVCGATYKPLGENGISDLLHWCRSSTVRLAVKTLPGGRGKGRGRWE